MRGSRGVRVCGGGQGAASRRARILQIRFAAPADPACSNATDLHNSGVGRLGLLHVRAAGAKRELKPANV